jgi:hypothetical protein
VLLSGDPGDPDTSGSAWAVAPGCALGKVAIWAFHGDQDATVDIANEEATMTRLLACPSPPRRPATWTVIQGGHDIWTPIFDLSGGSGDIYQWMLDNAKP